MGSTFPVSLFLILIGCSADPPSTITPEGLDACAEVRGAIEREECRFQVLQGLIDQPDALAATVASFSDPQSRDLALLRLAIAHPGHGATLCAQVTTSAATLKCKQVLGRPHLQRIQPHRPNSPAQP